MVSDSPCLTENCHFTNSQYNADACLGAVCSGSSYLGWYDADGAERCCLA